jgi:hypothetical protein
MGDRKHFYFPCWNTNILNLGDDAYESRPTGKAKGVSLIFSKYLHNLAAICESLINSFWNRSIQHSSLRSFNHSDFFALYLIFWVIFVFTSN